MILVEMYDLYPIYIPFAVVLQEMAETLNKDYMKVHDLPELKYLIGLCQN